MPPRKRRLWVAIPIAIAMLIAGWHVFPLQQIFSTGSGGIGSVSFGISHRAETGPILPKHAAILDEPQATYDPEVETRRSATRIAREIHPRSEPQAEAAGLPSSSNANIALSPRRCSNFGSALA